MSDYTVSRIGEIIDSNIPEALQEDWDNTGFQIAFSQRPVDRILTCLDVTESVADEAAELGVQLIVSHHPLIFGGITSITDESPRGRIIEKLIGSGISLYSSHTSFDKYERGNNFFLGNLLGLRDIQVPDGTDICITGLRPDDAPADLKGFAAYVAGKLGGGDILRCTGPDDKAINRIGICAGSGSEFAGLLQAAGCDLLITGDLKYHDAADAAAEGFAIIDAGHYGTERFFSGNMGEILSELLGDGVTVISSGRESGPFRSI